MARELTPEELDLLNAGLETTGHKKRSSDDDDGQPIERIKSPSRRRRRSFIFRPLFWGIAFLVIPTAFTVLFMSLITRVDAVMGTGALQLLAELSSEDLKGLGFENQGLEWIPQVVQLYDSRALILSIVWGVFLLASALCFYRHFRNRRLIADEALAQARSEVASLSITDRLDELERAFNPNGYNETNENVEPVEGDEKETKE